jgi:hypothetical protein
MCSATSRGIKKVPTSVHFATASRPTAQPVGSVLGARCKAINRLSRHRDNAAGHQHGHRSLYGRRIRGNYPAFFVHRPRL